MAKAKQQAATETGGDPSYADLYRRSIGYRVKAKDFKARLEREQKAHATTRTALDKATADLAAKPKADKPKADAQKPKADEPPAKADDGASNGELQPEPSRDGSVRLGSYTDVQTRMEDAPDRYRAPREDAGRL